MELKAGQGMFGKADPYCKMRIGVQEFSTKPNPGGGKNPIWNEEFSFDVANEKDMEIEVSMCIERFSRGRHLLLLPDSV